MEDDTDDTGGSDSGSHAESHEPSDATSRSDVEEAVISQRQDRGDPDPHRSDRGHHLRGRNDTAVGGRYEGLESYAHEARKNGTSIQSAMRDYADVEKRLRGDIVGGLGYLVRRMGADPQQVSAAFYQAANGQQGNAYTQHAAAQAEMSRHHSDIAEFAAKNRYFPQVRQQMAQLVQAGHAKDLASAYRLAINANATLRAKVKMEKAYAQADRDKARGRNR